MTFRSESPPTVWPPTIGRRPVDFTETLRRNQGRGASILTGALLMGLGFFVWEGGLGLALGILGAVMVAGAFLWQRRD